MQRNVEKDIWKNTEKNTCGERSAVIRTASLADLDEIVAVEAICFPAAEAAGRESIRERLLHFPDHFWLLEEDGRLVSFVNGMVTDCEHLGDEMYEHADMHDESGAWQMIFGVDTIPEHRGRGCAGKILKHVIEETKKQGRKGIVLTCKEKLVHYYAGFGFVDEGISDSTHGGEVWHEMRFRNGGAYAQQKQDKEGSRRSCIL